MLQNKYTGEATADRLRLERSQLTIDLQQMRMEQWQIAYMQEKAKQQPNSAVLLAAAFKALQAKANLAAWSSARVSEEQSDAAAAIQGIQPVRLGLAKLFKEGNLQALEDDLHSSAALDSELGITELFTEKFKERYARISEREDRLTWFFVLTYILGSMMIGADFVLKSRWKENANTSDGSAAATRP